MDQIANLQEALKHSPNNIPLKMMLGEALLSANRLDEAEVEFQQVIDLGPHTAAQFGLAKVFYTREEFAKCNVVLEGLLEDPNRQIDWLILHARALVKENELAAAVEVYQQVLALDPSFEDAELDAELKNSGISGPEVEDMVTPFVQKPSVDFDQVGGMNEVKKEIEMKIIQPLLHPDLYAAYGKKIGGGILLYGPPGCGKTFIAKATAGQVKARFMSVGLNDILDMWIGNSEKNLHGLFEIARDHKPCVLFFDEIDALGASRSDMRQSSGRHLINQFLQELDGIESDNEGVLILGATNTPWHLDPAFRRPGRFDRIIFVPPPDEGARAEIFKLKLEGKPLGSVDYKALAKKTKDFSGADIEAVIDVAIEDKLNDSFKSGVPEPISTKDLLKALKKHRTSTKEWFTSAKNFALYANDSGLYDDILNYLKIK